MPASAMLKPLLEGSPILVSVKTLDGRYAYVNSAWLSLHQQTSEQVLMRLDAEIFPAEFSETVARADRACLEQLAAVEAEHLFETGTSRRILHAAHYPLRDLQGTLCGIGTMSADVTVSHETQRKLEASEQRYRDLLEHSPEAFFVFDVTRARFVETNDNTEALFGMSREELLGLSPAQLSPPLQPDGRSSEEAASAYIGAALEGQAPVFDWLHRAKSGELLPCRIWLARVELEHGPGVRASILDMREIERIRSTLERTRAQLDAVQDALPQVVVVYEPDTNRMVLCNQTYQRLAPSIPLWQTAAVACRQAGEVGHARAEFSVSRGDGQGRLMEVEVSVFQQPGPSEPLQLLLVGTDITEQKELGARLQVSRNLETLGRLAGGVAHDFNNLLTVILGSAEFLVPIVAGDQTAQEDLAALKEAAKQAQDLTAQLLTFARSRQGQVRPVLVDEHLTASMQVLRRLAGEEVQAVFQLAAPNVDVLIDPGQFEQLLVNLMANAGEAMNGDGVITVTTQPMESTGNGELPPGRYVQIIVRDDGRGMNAETALRAFDPFFTTKHPGRGAGMGLAAAHGIVQKAGGRIDISSALDSGTTVRVILPAVPRTPASEGELDTASASARDVIRVLLVEDDDGVRGVNTRALHRAGHAVTAAANGEEALSLVRQGEEFDIVVTDVVMPKISGFELAERLRQSNGSLPFVFVSGYAEDALRERGLAYRDVNILQKPFAPDLLVSRVTETLTAARHLER